MTNGSGRGGGTFGSSFFTGSRTGGFDELTWMVLFFILVILFALDLGMIPILRNFYPKFVGFDASKFFTLSGLEKFLNAMLATGIIIYMAVYTILVKKGRISQSIDSLIWRWVLVTLLSITIMAGLSIPLIAHLVVAFMFRQYVLQNRVENVDRVFTLLIFIDIYGLDTITTIVGPFSTGAAVDIAKILVIPIWLLYLSFDPDIEKPFFAPIVGVVLICYIVFAGGVVAYADVKGAVEIGTAERPNPVQIFIDGFKEMYEGGKRAMERRFEYATGGYYESEVEEAEHEPLGVYLENIELADTEFYEDEAVSVWATLKARTLERDVPVNINVSCFGETGEDDEEKIEGEVMPNYLFTVYNLEEQDILCRFDKRALKSGSRDIDIYAEFNFKTMSYLKAYFMEKKRMRAMTREGIDIFNFFGITDRAPVAKSTQGPIKIGIGTATMPIGISKDINVNIPRFGVTVENQWEGRIRRINDLKIYVPKGMEINTENCNYPFLEKSDVNIYSNEGFEAYKLSEDGKKFDKFKDIEDFISIRCLLSIKGEDVDNILGEGPFTTKYFRVTVSYQYRLEESVSVDIKKPEGFNVYFSEEKPTSGSLDLKCIGKHSKENLKSASYEFYVNDFKEYYGDVTDCSGKECKKIIPSDIIKKGNKIKCVMNAIDKKDNEVANSGIVEIGNSLPSINVELPSIAYSNEDLVCEGIYSDADNDEPMKVVYEFSEGYFDDGKARCEMKDNIWLCKATAPKEELSVGETIRCKMTPYDSEDSKGESNDNYVTISAPPAEGEG